MATPLALAGGDGSNWYVYTHSLHPHLHNCFAGLGIFAPGGVDDFVQDLISPANEDLYTQIAFPRYPQHDAILLA